MEEIENEIANSKIPILVEFFAKWCRPCDVMEPLVKEIGQELDGRAKVLVINIEEDPELSKHFTIMNLPTFLIYRNRELVKRLTGVQDKSVLLALLA